MAAAFTGQVALVTGGARGIGFAVALELARRGCCICLIDLNATSLADAKKKLEGELTGAQVIVQSGDVAEVACGEAAVRAAVDQWGRVDVLVQAAGITGKTNITTDQALWQHCPSSAAPIIKRRVRMGGVWATGRSCGLRPRLPSASSLPPYLEPSCRNSFVLNPLLSR